MATLLETSKEKFRAASDAVGEAGTSLIGKVKAQLDVDPLDENNAHREGAVARAIETQTARVPSDWFLWAALASVGVSAALHVSGHKQTSNFVGHWAPTLLIFGLYNKIVKVAGSDQTALQV